MPVNFNNIQTKFSIMPIMKFIIFAKKLCSWPSIIVPKSHAEYGGVQSYGTNYSINKEKER